MKDVGNRYRAVQPAGELQEDQTRWGIADQGLLCSEHWWHNRPLQPQLLALPHTVQVWLQRLLAVLAVKKDDRE